MQPLISTLCGRAAELFADDPAVSVVGGPTLTFREVESRAARFAGGLKELGLGHADRVVLHLRNGWQWIVAYHAVARTGAIVVPANILLSAVEVAYLAKDSGASMVIAPAERCDNIRESLIAEKHLVACIIAEGESIADGNIHYEALLNSTPAGIAPCAPSDIATIAYTSGTTGRPKGAMLTHRNVFMSTALTATIHTRQRGEVTVTALPLPHVYGNVVMNAAFLVGMRLIIMDRFDAQVVLHTIQSERAAMLEGVPTMYYYLLSHSALKTTVLSSLRRCTVGGQTMPVAKINAVVAAFGCPLLELWGMTELAGPAVSHSAYWPARAGSIGLPFPTMEAKIVDLEDTQREMPADTPGELLVRGSLVTPGYWSNEAATRVAFTADGWFCTGDVGLKDPDGYLSIIDRKKDMIITAGYKVYPAELEQVIAAHPAVAMVAVVGLEDDVKGEIAKAFIVVAPNQSLSEQEVLDYCRSRLAAYKVPRAVEFLIDLPRTSTGKILRRELRDRSGGRQAYF